MNKTYLNCPISQLLAKTVKFLLLDIFSFGLAFPWLLNNYLKWLGTKVMFEGGGTFAYLDYNPSKLFFNNIRWILLSILTLGVYALLVPHKSLKYIANNTTITKNGNVMKLEVYSGLKYEALYGLKLNGYYLLTIITLGLATPFILMRIVDITIEEIRIRTNIGSKYCYHIYSNRLEGIQKNSFIKMYFLDYVLMNFTLGFYAIYFMYDLMNHEISRIRISERERKENIAR